MNSHGKKDVLKLCSAWQALLEQGTRPFSSYFDKLVRAGIAEKKSSRVELLDPETLLELIETHCPKERQKQAEARKVAVRLGLDIAVSSRADECLRLLRAIETGKSCISCGLMQQASAELFGDSKHIGRIAVLKNIWQAGVPSRGRLELKAFSPCPHRETGLDLAEVTYVAGSVLIDPLGSAGPEDFDFKAIRRAVTCENLDPFRQLILSEGLLIYCGGYASRAVAAWLRALPESCAWMHVGDVDMDGLSIFEDLVRKSGREGWFFPDKTALEQLADFLPQWKGSREMEPDKFSFPQVRDLAAMVKNKDLFAEQEGLLAACRVKGLALRDLGMDMIKWPSTENLYSDGRRK
ncbi:MAG: Wadjet anti-phage system protein JetD domain-containing protein [Thermodesulfobacteriota bacterium]